MSFLKGYLYTTLIWGILIFMVIVYNFDHINWRHQIPFDKYAIFAIAVTSTIFGLIPIIRLFVFLAFIRVNKKHE